MAHPCACGVHLGAVGENEGFSQYFQDVSRWIQDISLCFREMCRNYPLFPEGITVVCGCAACTHLPLILSTAASASVAHLDAALGHSPVLMGYNWVLLGHLDALGCIAML